MAHLLHIDSSIKGAASVSRKLTARAADAWLASHPGGAVAVAGLEPRFITAELTLAKEVPTMAGLVPLAEQSLVKAEKAVDALWAPATSMV